MCVCYFDMARTTYFTPILIAFLFSSPVFSNQVPSSLLKEIQSVNSTVEFFEKFVNGGYRSASGFSGKDSPADGKGYDYFDLGGHGIPFAGTPAKGPPERYPEFSPEYDNSVDIVESMGKCEPLETTVDVPLPENGLLITHPRCIKVKQCSGCCIEPHKHCQPIKKILTHFRVTHFLYNRNTRLLDVHQEDAFPYEEHMECSCQCKAGSNKCTEAQYYDEAICSCVCKNWKERNTCGANKVWDANKCECGCKQSRLCASRYTFNTTTCRCLYNGDV